MKTIKLLSNGKLASGGFDNLIKIWNLQTKNCEMTLEGHTGHVFCLDELNDGRLISGATDWLQPCARTAQRDAETGHRRPSVARNRRHFPLPGGGSHPQGSPAMD